METEKTPAFICSFGVMITDTIDLKFEPVGKSRSSATPRLGKRGRFEIGSKEWMRQPGARPDAVIRGCRPGYGIDRRPASRYGLEPVDKKKLFPLVLIKKRARGKS
jgi:hypothetical protein